MDNDVLARHHDELDARLCKLLLRADGGDTHDLAAEWNLLEAEDQRWGFEAARERRRDRPKKAPPPPATATGAGSIDVKAP